jgi:hypothetical protein
LFAIAAVTFAACSGRDSSATPTGPLGPAALPFTLETPNDDDAAVSLTVTGGLIDSLTAPGLRVLVLRSDSAGATVLIRGTFAHSVPLLVHVPERALAPRYFVQVDDAVMRGTYERRALDGYRVERMH